MCCGFEIKVKRKSVEKNSIRILNLKNEKKFENKITIKKKLLKNIILKNEKK